MGGDEVHIRFRSTAALGDREIADAVSLLSDEERARHRRFFMPHDARDYAAAHALLRRTLSRYSDRPPADWRFEHSPAGKPLIAEGGHPRFAVSLSHAAGMVACAVTGAEDVGIDVESMDRDVDASAIASRFFAPVEAAHLSRLAGDARRERFFDLWTLKEAMVKALGAGMAMALASLAFTVEDNGAIAFAAPSGIARDQWQFGLFTPAPRYRLAVAVRCPASHSAQLIVRSAADGR
jgi:phosphopantetheinyl transferase